MPSLEEAVRYLQELKQEVTSLRKQVKDAADRKAISDRDQEYSLDVMGAQDAWQTSEEDNVDSSNGLVTDVYIPPNGKTRHIKQVVVRIRLKAFRSYSAVTASGGGATVTSASGGGTTVSSASGGSSTPTSSSGGSSTPTSGGGLWYTEGGYTSGLDATNTQSSHTHGGAVAADGGHAHPITLNHSHTVTIASHQHTVTISAHTHDVTIGTHTHTVDVPSHTHGITGAITLGATASNCTIWINGSDRTTALTGAATFNVDQDELDVTQYMADTGYNTIEVRSSTLGRIRCTAFVNLYLNK